MYGLQDAIRNSMTGRQKYSKHGSATANHSDHYEHSTTRRTHPNREDCESNLRGGSKGRIGPLEARTTLPHPLGAIPQDADCMGWSWEELGIWQGNGILILVFYQEETPSIEGLGENPVAAL